MKFTKTKLITEVNVEGGLDSNAKVKIEAIANIYSYGEILDALESFYTKTDEQEFASMARSHSEEFRDFLDKEEDYKGAFDRMFDNPLDKLDDLKIREGTCGYDKNGNINPEDTSSKTPGGLKSMPADKRTQMVKKIMEKMKSNKS